jgi:hypothetical protein
MPRWRGPRDGAVSPRVSDDSRRRQGRESHGQERGRPRQRGARIEQATQSEAREARGSPRDRVRQARPGTGPGRRPDDHGRRGPGGHRGRIARDGRCGRRVDKPPVRASREHDLEVGHDLDAEHDPEADHEALAEHEPRDQDGRLPGRVDRPHGVGEPLRAHDACAQEPTPTRRWHRFVRGVRLLADLRDDPAQGAPERPTGDPSPERAERPPVALRVILPTLEVEPDRLP